MDYPIGELARRAGYAVQTLRYYEQIGLMPPPPRTEGRQRRYGRKHLERLLFIRHARDLGFEVEDVRSLLELAAHPDEPCVSVDAIARRHVAAISDKITRLAALRDEIEKMMDKCSRGQIANCRVIEALANHDACEH
jgi:DNA-binding transcriptional MerR regulator